MQGCPHANLVLASGWGSLLGVRTQLKEHYFGRFSGVVPQAFLDAHNLCSCVVCGKIISVRANGICPTCHPARRAAIANIPAVTPVIVLRAILQLLNGIIREFKQKKRSFITFYYNIHPIEEIK